MVDAFPVGPFRQLAHAHRSSRPFLDIGARRVVRVGARAVVDLVASKQDVPEVGIEFHALVAGTAFDADAAEHLVPDRLGGIFRSIEIPAGKFLSQVGGRVFFRNVGQGDLDKHRGSVRVREPQHQLAVHRGRNGRQRAVRLQDAAQADPVGTAPEAVGRLETAGHAALIQPGEDRIPHRAAAQHAAGVQDDRPGRIPRVRKTEEGDPVRGRILHPDPVAVQEQPVITGLDDLAVVREGRLPALHSLRQIDLSGDRHYAGTGDHPVVDQ